MFWKASEGDRFQFFSPHKLGAAQQARYPSQIAERETRSPWDFTIPGSFSDLITQFPRESERRSPRGGKGLRLGPISQSVSHCGPGPRVHGLLREAGGLCAAQSGTPWHADLASAVPPQPASGSLTAVVAHAGTRFQWLQRPNNRKPTYMHKRVVRMDTVFLFSRCCARPPRARLLARSVAGGGRGNFSRLMGQLAGVIELGAVWRPKLGRR